MSTTSASAQQRATQQRQEPDQRDQQRTDGDGDRSVQGRQEEITLHPLVDIYELKDRLILLADMPGVTRDGLKITVQRGQLSLGGHLDIPRQQGAQSGHYLRTFQLPEVIDLDAITASTQDGVVRLEMPKRPEFQTRRVAVSVRQGDGSQRRVEVGQEKAQAENQRGDAAAQRG